MNDNTSAFCAEEYDQKIKMTIPFYEEIYRQITDIVNVCFSGSVDWLDVGCGTGKMAETAFAHVPSVDRFVLCDHSEKMLETAGARLQSGKNTELWNCSILDLDIIDQFHVVTAVQVLHYFQREDRLRAIQKCYDALHENGIFVTFENFAPNSLTGREILLKRWESYQFSQGKSPEECQEHIARYGKDYFPITIKEHLEMLEQCCFRASEVIWVSNMQVGLLGIK